MTPKFRTEEPWQKIEPGPFGIIEWDRAFYVNDPEYNDTPARYYAGPFTRAEAIDFAMRCNENAAQYRRSPTPEVADGITGKSRAGPLYG